MLAAFEDGVLSVEAAEMMIQLLEDDSVPGAIGQELPLADKEVLLNRVLFQLGESPSKFTAEEVLNILKEAQVHPARLDAHKKWLYKPPVERLIT